MRTKTRWRLGALAVGAAAVLVWGRDTTAADRPPPLVSPAVAPAEPGPAPNPAPYLQAILGQLVLMNHQLSQGIGGGETPLHSCRYDERNYTEGAILKVSGVALVCVQRDWGGVESTEREVWVWEPIGSPRLAMYRKATGLRASR